MHTGEPQSLRQILATNTRAARRARGMSQEVLGDLAGLHRTFIGFIERAETNASLDNIEKIAKALDVEAHQLLTPQGAEAASGR